jgi:hypothetical protein
MHVLVACQVHPVVSRLCAPIEGTDAARLADCLGLDPAKYHAQAAAGTGMRDALEDALIASTATLDCDARYKASPALPSQSFLTRLVLLLALGSSCQMQWKQHLP